MVDPTGLYTACGAPSEYGPLPCFDSTEVYLPADPPRCSGSGGTGQCIYPDGTVYETGGPVNIYEGHADFLPPSTDSYGTQTEGDNAGGGGGGASSSDVRQGAGGGSGGGSCLANDLAGTGCIPQINDVIDAITGDCGRAVLNEINEALMLGILRSRGATGLVPSLLEGADSVEACASIGQACF